MAGSSPPATTRPPKRTGPSTTEEALRALALATEFTFQERPKIPE
ncbi:hypothetical protein [Streptomyces ambofaciens]|nr:hypothetical protein [Streptomyces ambofaciens]